MNTMDRLVAASTTGTAQNVIASGQSVPPNSALAFSIVVDARIPNHASSDTVRSLPPVEPIFASEEMQIVSDFKSRARLPVPEQWRIRSTLVIPKEILKPLKQSCKWPVCLDQKPCRP